MAGAVDVADDHHPAGALVLGGVGAVRRAVAEELAEAVAAADGPPPRRGDFFLPGDRAAP